MTKAGWLLLLLPCLAGCASSHGAMTDAVDAGVEHEIAARGLERKREFPAAAERYAASQVELDRAAEIARVRENQVFGSFIGTKLSIVASGQARCLEPRNNPAGSWERARELYVQAADYAEQISMHKLRANAMSDQARCTQPDHDPQGSWERAAALYADVVTMLEGLQDDAGRATALRLRALCLMKGDRSAVTPEARLLLIRARKLGDEEASELLAAAGGSLAYCRACGADLREADKFCQQCGLDRTKPVEKDAPPETGRAPGAPGGPPGNH